jgi:hypothetical protein
LAVETAEHEHYLISIEKAEKTENGGFREAVRGD